MTSVCLVSCGLCIGRVCRVVSSVCCSHGDTQSCFIVCGFVTELLHADRGFEISTVHGGPGWRSLYGGYTEHGVFSPVVVWRGFSSTRMRWLVGPVPFGASSSLSCGLCIECCVLLARQLIH